MSITPSSVILRLTECENYTYSVLYEASFFRCDITKPQLVKTTNVELFGLLDKQIFSMTLTVVRLALYNREAFVKREKIYKNIYKRVDF